MFTSEYQLTDTIIAVATPQGRGAIGIIRISGNKAFEICQNMFKPLSKNKDFNSLDAGKVCLGNILIHGSSIDEVLILKFVSPNSYTGEDLVEINCHGSEYIQSKILEYSIHLGARMASAGEFTLRAFLNKKLDLSQAEAVADLIHAETEAAHKIAINQLKGGFAKQLKELRQKMIDFAALITLELDFSEEDVEFADRAQFFELIHRIKISLTELKDSFRSGNSIKNGIPVAIAGKPNAGKSTLLNALLGEERAIVSNIAGTTRDTIEDTLTINGLLFRFIDTAGLRNTDDEIEKIGIKKAFEKFEKAEIIIVLFTPDDYSIIDELKGIENQKLLFVHNKSDLDKTNKFHIQNEFGEVMFISALNSNGISELKNKIFEKAAAELNLKGNVLVTNIRHFEALQKALNSLNEVEEGLKNNISGDLLSIDIKNALNHIGAITGEIDVDTDILGAVFSRFCIGK